MNHEITFLKHFRDDEEGGDEYAEGEDEEYTDSGDEGEEEY